MVTYLWLALYPGSCHECSHPLGIRMGTNSSSGQITTFSSCEFSHILILLVARCLLEMSMQARDQHSFLKRFVNDWATEEIVKQFMKNKCKNHYRNGWLEPPAKYAYLKQNSSMRDPTASRTKRVNMHPEAEGSRKKRNTGAAAAAAREEDDSGEE